MTGARWLGSGALLTILALIILAQAMRGVPAVTAPPPGSGDEAWKTHLTLVDHAVDAGDIGLAYRSWRNAYGAALTSRRWEPMFAVGQAALRMERAAGAVRARECYLTVLFRARQQRSVGGVLVVTEAFARLGDLALATASLRIAEQLARQERDDPQAPLRVAAVRDRLGGRAPGDGGMPIHVVPVLLPGE